MLKESTIRKQHQELMRIVRNTEHEHARHWGRICELTETGPAAEVRQQYTTPRRNREAARAMGETE